MDRTQTSVQAQEKLQGCVIIGGVLLVVGVLVMLIGGPAGIVVAAMGQAVLLVGLVGYGVKLGLEAAERPARDAVPGD
jgi:hypothetical protein